MENSEDPLPRSQKELIVSAVARASLNICGNAFNAVALLESRFKRGILSDNDFATAISNICAAMDEIKKIGNLENVKFIESNGIFDTTYPLRLSAIHFGQVIWSCEPSSLGSQQGIDMVLVA